MFSFALSFVLTQSSSQICLRDNATTHASFLGFFLASGVGWGGGSIILKQSLKVISFLFISVTIYSLPFITPLTSCYLSTLSNLCPSTEAEAPCLVHCNGKAAWQLLVQCWAKERLHFLPHSSVSMAVWCWVPSTIDAGGVGLVLLVVQSSTRSFMMPHSLPNMDR